jgi:hypothetical protein
MKGLICLGALIAAQSTAWAEQAAPAFGDRGRVALSVERLFGYTHAAQTTPADMNTAFETTTTTNSISLLGSPFAGVVSLFSFSRLGIDVFAARGLSLGASVGYSHLSQSASLRPMPVGVTLGEASLNGVLAAPRIGYALRANDVVSIWPRAGITFVYLTTDTSVGTSTSLHLLDLTLEAWVSLALAPRVHVLIGPTFDIGLEGHTTRKARAVPDMSNDIKETDIGVQTGLLILL